MRSYLGMYDVSCPRHRSRLFRILSAYGIHQQKSVFECRLNPEFRQQLLQQLSAVPNDSFQRIVLIQVYPHHPYSLMLGAAKWQLPSHCLYIS